MFPFINLFQPNVLRLHPLKKSENFRLLNLPLLNFFVSYSSVLSAKINQLEICNRDLLFYRDLNFKIYFFFYNCLD